MSDQLFINIFVLCFENFLNLLVFYSSLELLTYITFDYFTNSV